MSNDSTIYRISLYFKSHILVKIALGVHFTYISLRNYLILGINNFVKISYYDPKSIYSNSNKFFFKFPIVLNFI